MPIKILVAIANYGCGNRKYLEKLISSYEESGFDVDIVILSNVPNDLGENIEVRVGLPTSNPRSLPFAHRDLFYERRNDYDLYIYSEDDTLVTRNHILSFLSAQDELEPNEITGFLRMEQSEDGLASISSIHSYFRWKPDSVCRRGENIYAEFSNEHAACFILTRGQLEQVIDSGGFLVPPHEGRHDMLCTAATDPYTQCGLKKLICLNRFDEFLLPHLPNRYIGTLGIDRKDVSVQLKALTELAEGEAESYENFNVETCTRSLAKRVKNCYEKPSKSLLECLESWENKSVLSVGAGWGATENALAARGATVTVIPVDPVFGKMCESRGLRVISKEIPSAIAELGTEKFDVILFQDVLHLDKQPLELVGMFSKSLRAGGSLVATVPEPLSARHRLLRTSKNIYKALLRPRKANDGTIDKAALVPIIQDLKTLPVRSVRTVAEMSPRRKVLDKLFFGCLSKVLANRFVVTARC